MNKRNDMLPRADNPTWSISSVFNDLQFDKFKVFKLGNSTANNVRTFSQLDSLRSRLSQIEKGFKEKGDLNMNKQN